MPSMRGDPFEVGLASPKARTETWRDEATEWIDSTRSRAQRWIARHPKVSLAIALTAGAVTGWIIKRRL